MPTLPTSRERKIKAVLLDFMDTCLDWHSSILPIRSSSLSQDVRPDFALEWRQTFDDHIMVQFMWGISAAWIEDPLLNLTMLSFP